MQNNEFFYVFKPTSFLVIVDCYLVNSFIGVVVDLWKYLFRNAIVYVYRMYDVDVQKEGCMNCDSQCTKKEGTLHFAIIGIGK